MGILSLFLFHVTGKAVEISRAKVGYNIQALWHGDSEVYDFVKLQDILLNLTL